MKFTYILSLLSSLIVVNAKNIEKNYPQPTPIINTNYHLIPVPSPTSKRIVQYKVKHNYNIKKYKPINFKPIKPCNFDRNELNIEEIDNEHCNRKLNKEDNEGIEEIIYIE